MTHLGEKVSALVDGQLSLEATERAHAHLACCRPCRDLVEGERQMKARLSCLPAPELGADLVGRLLALGGPSGPLPPRPGHVPGSPRPTMVALPVPTSVSTPVSFSEATSWLGGGVLAGGSGRIFGARSRFGVPRPAGSPSASSRPTGRPAGPRRARLAGVVLGALGVVGAGVGGLVLASPEAPRGVPSQARLDSFVVQRPLQTRTVVTADMSLELQRPRSFVGHSVEPSPSGR